MFSFVVWSFSEEFLCYRKQHSSDGNMGKLKLTITFGFVLLVVIAFLPGLGSCADDNVWYVSDVIEPTVDQVKWTEQGGIKSPIAWIADGSWSYASLRESLVGDKDIFVSTYERFDWTKVQSSAQQYYGLAFNSFNDFAAEVQSNPSPWLDLSWQMDTQWYGIYMNTTKVDAYFDQSSSTGELYCWFHITRIPEYLEGQKALDNWLTGFDLTSVSTGNLKLWELSEDWGASGIYYNLRFEAPSGMLVQHGGNYTCFIGVAATYQGNSFKINQGVEINMPADTVILEATPEQFRVVQDHTPQNTAAFTITRSDRYPRNYTVVSGPQVKSSAQVVQEALSAWFLAPAGWAAIASLSVLLFTGLRGRKVWRRNSLYHRLYRSMVTLFDLYSKDAQRFHAEMDTVSKSIFKMMVDDKITDDQFEKLLKRRDDLLERADKLQPPPPPTRN
jgi:hypothetical protein